MHPLFTAYLLPLLSQNIVIISLFQSDICEKRSWLEKSGSLYLLNTKKFTVTALSIKLPSNQTPFYACPSELSRIFPTEQAVRLSDRVLRYRHKTRLRLFPLLRKYLRWIHGSA